MLVWARANQQQDNAPVNGRLGCRDASSAHGGCAAAVRLGVPPPPPPPPISQTDRDGDKTATSSSSMSPSAGENSDFSVEPVAAVAENCTAELGALEPSSRSPAAAVSGPGKGRDLTVVSGDGTKGEDAGSEDAHSQTDGGGVLRAANDEVVESVQNAGSKKQPTETGEVRDATVKVTESDSDERVDLTLNGVALGRARAGSTGEISLAKTSRTVPGVPQPDAGLQVTNPQEEVPDLGIADEADATNHADEQHAADPASAPRRKKTRRGKRAGGVLNRRRGAKERAAKREEVVACASVVTDVPEAVDETVTLSCEEAASADGIEENVTPVPSSDHDRERDKQVATSPQSTVAVTPGTTVDIAGGAKALAAVVPMHTAGIPADPGYCSTCVSEIHEPLLPLPVLENAAARSIQDLRAMLIPSSTSESKRDARDSSCAGSSSNIASAGHFWLQIRRRGVLESLVALCAPFPWSPVLSSLPNVGQPSPSPCGDTNRDIGPELRACRSESASTPPTTRAGSGSNAAAVAATSAATTTGAPSRHGAGCERVGQVEEEAERGPLPADSSNMVRLGPSASSPRSPPLSQPRKGGASPPKTAKGRKAVDDVGVGGLPVGAGGRREWLMASALSVLCEALAEPRNVDYLLVMDGAAPLVSAVDREVSWPWC